jgi:predicted flap endonuclease-1-like 5' DNA nuclease
VIAILVIIIVSAAFALGYVFGRARRGGLAAAPAPVPRAVAMPAAEPAPAPSASMPAALPAPISAAVASMAEDERAVAERARIIRSYESEAAALRGRLVTGDAENVQLRSFAADRRQQFVDLAQARADTARYRQIVVDLENNAPSLLFGPGAPDDLKLIVGVGPVLERMLHQLGVGTYRQIAHWSERDIDDFDARLPEFPGRIRRDGWVTQARALHQAKYGEVLPVRGS